MSPSSSGLKRQMRTSDSFAVPYEISFRIHFAYAFPFRLIVVFSAYLVNVFVVHYKGVTEDGVI